MQLAELALILVEEAKSSRDDLMVAALQLSTLEDGDGSEALLQESAATYTDFCERTSSAVESIGLTGLAKTARLIGEGVSMAPGLPLELRTPAEPLLCIWPEFFVSYVESWAQGQPDKELIAALLDCMTQAEFVTPLTPEQLTEIGDALLLAPSLAEQQAAMTVPFTPPSAEAMSLEIPFDSDRSVIEGFLAEGPSQVERLMSVVADLGTAAATSSQLELAHRTAHTLKGTAAIAGIRGIATLAHALEDLLEFYREDDFQAPDGLRRVMLAGCDQLDLGLVHLTDRTETPPDFAQVTSLLHAWSGQLQGLDVPPEALQADFISAVQAVSSLAQPTNRPAEPTEGLAVDARAEEEAQIRIPAKALDKIFRSINELAIGLLRLRLQTDDLLNRGEAIGQLEQTATLRLAEIERRVTLEGLGRVEQGGLGQASGPFSMSVPSSAASNFDEIELDRYNELTGATQALSEAIGDIKNAREDLIPSLRDVTALSQRQLEFAREARYQITQARLRPLSDLRSRLRRTVRQTCAVLGKDVALDIVGDDLRVDAAVLEPLSEALLHLLRNSVDHGIEPAERRMEAGKSAQGNIRVVFTGKGGGVVCTISDDGKGLDHEAILDKAMWSGLVAPDAKMSRDEIGRLIFLPGFSTRNVVTETSGRGVGLDAVVQALASLQGNVSVSSKSGVGTEFRLFALASVGTIHALHVEAEGEHFLVPSIQLVRADPADATDILLDSDSESTMPSVWLPTLLHGLRQSTPSATNSTPSLVVDIDGSQRRINVSKILEAREFLITPAPEMIDRLPGVSGVTTLADGSLGIVLDLLDLSRQPLPVQQQGLREMQAAVQQQLHILLADDSASVRNTISALLRDENYKITAARDGLEGMQAVLDQRFDLVLTDLEMPQLNGFELTEFIRNRSDQRDVPVIMLTSRGQDKHRLRAQEAGVDAFLIKPYSDQHLLETVRSAIADARQGKRSQRVTATVSA